MAAEDRDTIYIEGLALSCIIGVNERERQAKQQVIVNIHIATGVANAAHADNIQATIDYKKLYVDVVRMVEASSYYLVEALAEAIATLCLGHPKARKVTVSVEKPSALKLALRVGVKIVREHE